MSIKTYTLEIEPLKKIQVLVSETGSGKLIGTLKEECPYCKQTDCFKTCEESKGDLSELESDEEAVTRMTWNVWVGIVELLILAHACEGIDVSAEPYVSGIHSTLETFSNQL